MYTFHTAILNNTPACRCYYDPAKTLCVWTRNMGTYTSVYTNFICTNICSMQKFTDHAETSSKM